MKKFLWAILGTCLTTAVIVLFLGTLTFSAIGLNASLDTTVGDMRKECMARGFGWWEHKTTGYTTLGDPIIKKEWKWAESIAKPVELEFGFGYDEQMGD